MLLACWHPAHSIAVSALGKPLQSTRMGPCASLCPFSFVPLRLVCDSLLRWSLKPLLCFRPSTCKLTNSIVTRGHVHFVLSNLEGAALCCMSLDNNIAALMLPPKAAGPNYMAGPPPSSSRCTENFTTPELLWIAAVLPARSYSRLQATQEHLHLCALVRACCTD